MPSRPFQEFVKVYPKPFVVSRDRLSVQEAGDCTADKRDALVSSIEASLLRDLTLTPRVPQGRSTLSDYIEASAASTFGIERAVVLYLACQWAIRSGGAEIEERAKALGIGSKTRGVDLSRATFSQAIKLLGIDEQIKLDDPEAFAKTLKILEEKKSVDAPIIHEFYDVANHYARTALVEGMPNWSVLQNWLTGRPSLNEGGLAESIASGAKINATRLADELIAQAAPINLHKPEAIAHKTIQTAHKWMMTAPHGYFPHFVNKSGYDVHIASGNSIFHDNFVNNVFAGHNWSETFRGFKVDARGVCFGPPYKKIFVSTGNIIADEKGFSLEEERYKRTLMEEMFHAAEGSTFIKIGKHQVNPRHLIDRTKINLWTAALPERAAQLEDVIKNSGMEGKLGDLENRIGLHLMMEGTHSADDLQKMSFKDKMVALSDGIINLHSGYEMGGFVSRNAETLVRMHRAYHLVFSDMETGMNATPLLGIMMPELYGLYTKVVMPEMLKNEAKAIASTAWDKFKIWCADKVQTVKSWFGGGAAKVSGMSADQILGNVVEEQREQMLAKEMEKHLLSVGSRNLAGDPVLSSFKEKEVLQEALLASEAGAGAKKPTKSLKSVSTLAEIAVEPQISLPSS